MVSQDLANQLKIVGLIVDDQDFLGHDPSLQVQVKMIRQGYGLLPCPREIKGFQTVLEGHQVALGHMADQAGQDRFGGIRVKLIQGGQ